MALEIDWLSRLFSVDMGIDLGTCNTLVCVRGEGIVLNEPSVVAVRKGTNIVLNNGEAVGFAAKDMLGKTPGSISAVRPLKDGVISDFAVTEAMLGYFIKKVNGKSTRIFGPRVVIAIPSGIEHGQQIKYQGMGDNSIPGIQPGGDSRYYPAVSGHP